MRIQNDSQKWLRLPAFFILSALGIAGVLCLWGGIFSQNAVAAGQTNKTAQAQSPFEDHADQAGIKTCRDVFTTLGSVMASESNYRTATFWNQKEGNKHAVGSIAGLDFKAAGLDAKGAGVVYSAPVGGNCEGVSVRIVPLAQPCTEFAASFSKDVSGREDLNGVELLLLASGAKVMALPVSDKQCVAVTTMFGNGELQ